MTDLEQTRTRPQVRLLGLYFLRYLFVPSQLWVEDLVPRSDMWPDLGWGCRRV